MKFQLILFSNGYFSRYCTIIILLLLIPFKNKIICQELPLGYISYFSHNCGNESLFNYLLPEYEQDWSVIKEDGRNVLQIKPSEDTLSRTIPMSRGVLKNTILGDYILEFDVKTPNQNNNDTAGFCFLGPVKSTHQYYSLIFSKDTLRFLSINNDSIWSDSISPYPVLKESWNKIRIERDILNRSLLVTINNDKQNSVSFSDRHLVMGYIGFGSQHSIVYLRNISLWAPTAIEEQPFQW